MGSCASSEINGIFGTDEFDCETDLECVLVREVVATEAMLVVAVRTEVVVDNWNGGAGSGTFREIFDFVLMTSCCGGADSSSTISSRIIGVVVSVAGSRGVSGGEEIPIPSKDVKKRTMALKSEAALIGDRIHRYSSMYSIRRQILVNLVL